MKAIEANLWKVCVMRGLTFSMVLSVPTIVSFWQENGLGLRQISLLQALFSLTLVLAEVPTGYAADLLGRKRSLTLGAAVMVCGSLVYGLSSGFGGFLAGEVLLGLGVSFINGADQALLFDSLAELGAKERFQKLWGRANAVADFWAASACVFGGWVAQFGLRLPILLSAALLAVNGCIAFSLAEPARTALVPRRGHAAEIVQIGRSVLLRRTPLRWAIGYSAMLFGFMQGALWLYQPYFEMSGVRRADIGWTFAALSGTSAVLASLAWRVEARIGLIGCNALAFAGLLGGFALSSSVVAPCSFLFFLLHQFCRGFNRVVFSHHLHQQVPSEIRATVVSIKSMVDRSCYGLVLAAIWLGAGEAQPTSVFAALGAAAAVAGLWGLMVRPGKV